MSVAVTLERASVAEEAVEEAGVATDVEVEEVTVVVEEVMVVVVEVTAEEAVGVATREATRGTATVVAIEAIGTAAIAVMGASAVLPLGMKAVALEGMTKMVADVTVAAAHKGVKATNGKQ